MVWVWPEVLQMRHETAVRPSGRLWCGFQ
ncbi:hypothetical protein C5167_000595 [Papaver somniferum]|uniref:Uncharacterized protein n=1 Tax=Papaver somniferum TaxID=3469 RepID=A0A4Y7KWZ2_PAPSO|nr:hypothetical protein C5167_000595 [Papaver somniferum]